MLRNAYDVPVAGQADKSSTRRSCVKALAVALMLGAAGCSADLGRFDSSGGGSPLDNQRVASGPVPRETIRRAGIPADHVPPPQSTGAIEPMPPGDPAPGPAYGGRPTGTAGYRPPAKPRPAPPQAAAPAAHGETIDVQPGDTLFAISKRYKVSMSELMSINGLQGPNLKPGQKLMLPAGRRAVPKQQVVKAPARPQSQQAAVAPPAVEQPLPPVTAARTAPPQKPHQPVAAMPPASTAGWAGSHTIAPGESIYGIARKHHVKVADLEAANGITDPTKIRAGTVLRVPGSGEPPVPPVAATRSPAIAVRTERVRPEPAQQVTPPPALNEEPPAAGRQRIAALPPDPATQNDALPASAPPPSPEKAAVEAKIGPTGRFRWPVRGKVIASYGPRADNTRNDGINIAVPSGTDVAAAETGVVAYAGNDLKGYGNLVLVRHENNWVSAYAHNDSLLVKTGDKIKRGQVIAKAGASGSVDQPQVHFELRQGSKPVDPMPHMEQQR